MQKSEEKKEDAAEEKKSEEKPAEEKKEELVEIVSVHLIQVVQHYKKKMWNSHFAIMLSANSLNFAL